MFELFSFNVVFSLIHSDNFLTDEEASALVSTASSDGQGWERSTDTGKIYESL